MIISVNWLKKFVPIDRSIDELAELIGSRLVEIEDVVNIGDKYRDVIVAQVKSVEAHPNADRLNVVLIEDGGVRQNIERDENGLVQVVCGAKNVREGMLVAWLPPGSTVPATAADAEPFVLDARELRGVKSSGMLASAKELAFSDDHEGIVDIDKSAEPGASFAELYELNDYLLDIENKSLTHRPDAFGLIGFAREVAAIQGLQFETPKWFTMLEPVLAEKTPSELLTPTVTIQDAEVSERYQAVVLASIDAARTSPMQIQSYLYRVGVRPISVAVDTTNYLMLLTGQPLHAFDYDKFVKQSSTGKPDIVVRKSKKGETLQLLDGRTITLSDEDIVIAAGETPVGLAGAMGGATTEITLETKNILLEVATFDLYSLRATQMRHGIFTEAITRYTKGQPAPLTAPVLASAVRMLSDLAGGERVTDVVDVYPHPLPTRMIRFAVEKVNDLLGTTLSVEAVLRPLQQAEFIATAEGDTLIVAVPYWRNDIHIAEDVIEEVGRVLGYDMVAPSLPLRTYRAVSPEPFDAFKANLRQRLTSAGANELLTYSFVHSKILEGTGQKPDRAYRITNAISPELHYYRLSLMPSLLTKIHPNIKQNFENFALYEINKVHQKGIMDQQEPGVPAEFHHLALSIAANKKTASGKGSAFYHAKYLLEYVLKRQKLVFRPLQSSTADVHAPFQPERSAEVLLSGEVIGVVGEYTAKARANFKLPDFSAGFEIDLDKTFHYMSTAPDFVPPARFQGTEKDICVQVTPRIRYEEVVETIEDSLSQTTLEWTLSPVDIYQPDTAAYKNVTVRLTLHDAVKTIAAQDVKKTIEAITQAVKVKLNAKVI